MTIRVVIADDHTLVRQGLRKYLETSTDVEVVGEAATGAEALAEVERTQPEVALLDIRMPDMDGLEAARAIRDRFPQIGVVMLTAFDDRQFLVDAVRAGARGYVLKARDAEHLTQTVRMVAAGNLVIDPDLVGALSEEIASNAGGIREALSGRELEILQLLAFGHTNKAIAKKLFLSPDTVKSHLEHIFQKLGAPDRTAAVAEGMRRRLID